MFGWAAERAYTGRRPAALLECRRPYSYPFQLLPFFLITLSPYCSIGCEPPLLWSFVSLYLRRSLW